VSTAYLRAASSRAMPYTIRPAESIDIAAIRNLAAAVWPVAYRDILSPEQLAYMLELFYSEEALTEQMEVRGHQFFLALDEADVAVGFASFSVSREVAHLHKLYVLPQTQGSGTGAALLRHCEIGAKQASASVMQLNVNRHNRAKAFYEHQGYDVILEEDIHIGEGFYMNDYRMAKQLAS
jgi:ribosomal protein S18 acetylase RimI-like enzyme